MLIFFGLSFAFLIPTILCWETTFSRDEPHEYLGCFHDSNGERLFQISPGDYLPDDLSPVGCMNACGKRWHIAGIQNGDICLCSKFTPTTFVNDILCNATCSGATGYSEKPKCGGYEYLSVFNISKRIIGLKILELPVLMLYNTANILKNPENVTRACK